MSHRLVRRVLLAVAVAVLAQGCLYMNVVAPLDTDLHETRLGGRVGRSESHAVLGLIAWGDSGTQAAARAGGITTLLHADQEVLVVLGFVYARQRTVVYGD